MMLRSLVDEVVRRRLWPIPLAALLIAIAAPVLFMRSAPADAPAASDLPPAAAQGKLPVSAEKLLTTSDKVATPHKRSHRTGQDPFAPPASAAKVSKKSGTASTRPAATKTPQAIPVVITNSGGSSTAKATPQQSTTTQPKTTTPAPSTTPTASVAQPVTVVDARFAKQQGSLLRYRVPRLQTFQAGGRVAAMFVGYSAERHVAVFAVAPSTQVKGDVKCRKVENVCRYVDIPAGGYARLVLRAADGSVVSRRLDVVRIRKAPQAATSKATARKTSLSAATCLLKSLLALPATAASISTDACA